MKAIKGILENGHIIPLEKFPKNKKFKVIITILEELNEEEDLRNFTSQDEAFSFWENNKEDLYQDYLNKK